MADEKSRDTTVFLELLEKVVKITNEQTYVGWEFNKELLEFQTRLFESEAYVLDIHRKKFSSTNSEASWVKDLHHIVSNANDDLLNRLVSEDLRRRRKEETRKIKKILNCISLSNFKFNKKIAKELTVINQKLLTHYCKAGYLEKSTASELEMRQARETTSGLSDVFEVVGREIEVSNIVNQLVIDQQQVMPILPIVGMGGLGKTILAKLVLKHEKIKRHYDPIIWVYVSDFFSINKILEAMLGVLTLKPTPDTRDALIWGLKKVLKNKRYLLVLDDVWNESPYHWSLLKDCLLNINKASENTCSIVTTRSDQVAQIMGTLPRHHLTKLPVINASP